MIVTVWPFQSRRMSLYTVHEPPELAIDRMERAEQMLFLKDGFNWAAFVIAPVWLLMNRLWLGLALYVGASIAIAAGFSALDLHPGWISLATVGLHAVVGYEAHALQVYDLERRGWSQAGAVMGASEPECERRFFEGWLPTQAPLRHHPAVATVPHTVAAPPAVAPAEEKPARKRRFAFWRK